MNWKSIKALSLFSMVLLGFGAFDSAFATDSRTRTTTTRNQSQFTDNANIRDPNDPLDDSLVEIDIQGGTLSFNLCAQGIHREPEDLACRVTPPLIPPGADTQLGVGLDPIAGAGPDATLSFGGPTNDKVPVGSSNVQIPGFSVHGGLPPTGIGGLLGVTGEVTNNCNDAAFCGQGMNSMRTTHFQTLQSLPKTEGIAAGICLTGTPPAETVRCNRIEFAFDENINGAEQAQGRMAMEFRINSETDVNGDLVGTASGSYTINCPVTGDQFGCPAGTITGSFTVTPPNPAVVGGGFTSTSTGFVTMSQDAPNNTFCPPGTTVDPFHREDLGFDPTPADPRPLPNSQCQAR